MALSDKDVARKIIDELPDDATLGDIAYTMYVRAKIERGLRDSKAGNLVDHADVEREMAAQQEAIPRRLVRKGHIMVLEPVHPVPSLTADTVNDLLDEMRQEREDRFLGLRGSES